MVGQAGKSVTSPTRGASNDWVAKESGLRATFIADERAYTGARCELPGGEVVEVKGRNTPFFAICRELAKRGYGDCRIEISTPTGTPSIRAAVGVAAGLAISERDGRGLRLEKYRPFRVRGRPTDAHEGLQGSPAPGTVATRLASHRAGAKAA